MTVPHVVRSAQLCWFKRTEADGIELACGSQVQKSVNQAFRRCVCTAKPIAEMTRGEPVSPRSNLPAVTSKACAARGPGYRVIRAAIIFEFSSVALLGAQVRFDPRKEGGDAGVRLGAGRGVAL